MKQLKHVTVVGASGLIGSRLLKLLLADPDIEQVHIPARRALDIADKRARVSVIDLTDVEALSSIVTGSDAVFVAVGTTQAQVKGNPDAYRRVDFEIPVSVARACKAQAIPQLLLISSVGADAGSRNFYLKIKGEVEEEIQRIGIPSVSVFRPSLLLGKRTEIRPGERLAQAVMPWFSFLLPSKYRAISAAEVAAAMYREAKNPSQGFSVLQYREIVKAKVR
jgi:uncharacterized protein YbjT (DUF2867 family)